MAPPIEALKHKFDMISDVFNNFEYEDLDKDIFIEQMKDMLIDIQHQFHQLKQSDGLIDSIEYLAKKLKDKNNETNNS